jgi:hypothetical protein
MQQHRTRFAPPPSRAKTLHQVTQNLYSLLHVTLTSTNRAVIAVAIILLISAAGIGIYFYFNRPPSALSPSPPSPQLPGISVEQAPDLLSELPADAPAVAYIDVAALRQLENSPLAALLGLTSPGPEADREYAEFVHQTGFDYTRDLDKAAIAFWPRSFALEPGAGLGQNRVLAIADGRFDQKKIEAYALRTGKAVTTVTPIVYEVPGNPPISIEFLSPTRIAIASGKNAREILDQASHPAKRDPVMKARIERVAGAPIFAVARTDNLPDSLYSAFGNAQQLEKLARSVRGLSLAGQPDGNNIRAALDAECDTVKSAFELSTLLDGFRMVGSMALSDPKSLRQMTKEQAAFLQALIRQLKITRQDRWVRLRLDLTPQMLGARPAAAFARPPAAPPTPAATQHSAQNPAQ